MMKIESLTPAQEKKLAEYRDKWTAIGLSTEPLDVERAKAAVAKAYQAAGLEPPQLYLHFGDPIQAAIAAVYLKAWVAEVENKFEELGVDADSSSVWESVYQSVRQSVGELLYGYHDANWLGFYEYFRDELGTDCHKLDGLIELAKCCGWWGPYRGFAIMQDRLSICKRDDQGRLHCEDGMACMYPTGLGWYFWHGVRVEERVIMAPETITLSEILAEKSAEIRRIMAERMGYAKYLHESGAQLIDFDMVDITPNGKQMPRALLKDKFGDYYLEGTDGSTERSYFMRVLATQTCREAHQSLCGLDESLCVAQS